MQGIPLSTFQSNYRAMLAYVRYDKPRAALVRLDIWQDPSAKNRLGQPRPAYNAIITSGCAGTHRQMADDSQLCLDPRKHWSMRDDTYHPNDRGRNLIAPAILMAMPPV
jgi:hypothetical protein